MCVSGRRQLRGGPALAVHGRAGDHAAHAHPGRPPHPGALRGHGTAAGRRLRRSGLRFRFLLGHGHFSDCLHHQRVRHPSAAAHTPAAAALALLLADPAATLQAVSKSIRPHIPRLALLHDLGAHQQLQDSCLVTQSMSFTLIINYFTIFATYCLIYLSIFLSERKVVGIPYDRFFFFSLFFSSSRHTTISLKSDFNINWHSEY